MNNLIQLNQLIRYIDMHLSEEIDPEFIESNMKLPYATLSRLFSSLTGITLYKYMKYRCLSEAAKELSHTDIKVIDLAHKYGYESSEAFSYAFKAYHKLSPTAVRKGGVYKSFLPISLELNIEGGNDIKVNVETISGFKVSALKMDEVKKFILKDEEGIDHYYHFMRLLSQVAEPDKIDLYELMLPNQGGLAVYYLACQKLASNLEKKVGMEEIAIPQGKYIVFKIKSPINRTIHHELDYILANFFKGNNSLPGRPLEFVHYQAGDRESSNYEVKVYMIANIGG